jgi:hypothetical protein
VDPERIGIGAQEQARPGILQRLGDLQVELA